MYSLVLMAALTSGADLPACHRWAGSSCYGCHGCNGCYGCYGCYGCSGCYGCYGAGCHGGYLGLSCYGCYGNYGQYPYVACGGCSCGGPFHCHGCYGCYGCYGCHGMMPVVQPLGVPTAPAAKPDEKMPAPEKKAKAAGPARLLVELPADAKLYVDDHLMKASSERREFNTPTLVKGNTYYYILKVELAREGKTISETKRVLVRSGDLVKASFTEESIVAAAKDSNPAVAADAGR